MELSSQEGEIPMNSATYGGGQHGNGHGLMIHHDHDHNHIMSSTSAPNANGTVSMQQQEEVEEEEEEGHGHGIMRYSSSNMNMKKVVVRYRECLKNHAAAMGGNATDGCGEFMPSGEEGTIEALNCSACHCHRNFHRKEVEGEPSSTINAACDVYYRRRLGTSLHHHNHKNLLPAPPAPPGLANILPSRSVPPHHQMIMPYNYNIGIGHLPSESDEQEEPGHGHGIMVQQQQHHASRTPSGHQLLKKRFRTKFTQEQKDKMLNFAEKVGWKIQKQEESVVQHFCQEIGVKRRVLKVWMHNNKHNLAKKNPPPPSST